MSLIESAMITYEAHVTRTQNCWGWKGSKNPGGYGKITVRIDGKATTISAHKLSYQVHKGDVTSGLSVLHKCDNPCCTNPDHLFLGTHKNNMEDKIAKGRGSTVKSISNAKLTRAQVLYVWGHRNSTITAQTLATELEVNEYTVRDIWLKRTWTHITNPTPTPQGDVSTE